MRRSSFILICAAALMLALAGITYAAYTPADIAGTWESGGHATWVLGANGTFSSSYKDFSGGKKTFTGTFKITNDVIRFTRTDGKGYGTYKILSLSADKKVMDVRLGTSKQTWKKK